MKQPPIGLTTKAKVVNIIDGDTLDVKIERTIRVRLEDCWCPEKKTKDIVEKQKGLEALSHASYLAYDKDVVLFIPADREGDIKDIFTFGRAIGRIFINGEDMSTMMIKAGHATETKQ